MQHDFFLLSSRFDDVTMSNFGWTAFFFDKEDFSFYAKLCLMANIEFLQKKMKGKYVTFRTVLYKGIFLQIVRVTVQSCLVKLYRMTS